MPDYANPQSLNRYSYVINNPLRYTDPTGHMMSAGDDGGKPKKSCPSCVQATQDKLKKYRETHDPIVSSTYTAADLLAQNQDDPPPGPITEAILDLPGSEDFYNAFATTFDSMAWLTDLFAAGAVTYGGIAGAGLGAPGTVVGGPAVPTVTGLGGMFIAELYVQPVLTVGNGLASLSTALTVIADTKAGNTRIEDGVFSSDVRNSFTLTAVGWVNKEAYLSLILQSVALTNDFGWTSLPFRPNP